ncbi:MAG: ABC transporter ATP-binding protein [Oscillatoriales cyanobacterium SM2_1_8]|nr:ABC transporter ATP-binding protein [Oscillatoriales cyanobacterium SM2_1_8]
MSDPLHLESVTAGYGTRPVVQDVNLTVRQGEWLTVIGANGSGKSTLLKTMAAQLPPLAGTIWLEGQNLHRLTPRTVAQRLGFLPQQPGIPEGLTVRQLVALGRNPHQPWWQWEVDAAGQVWVERALTETNLLPFAERTVATLSGGERQRAFAAVALAQNAHTLLLDEPTTYLDVNHQLELLDLLKRWQREGLTVVTVLHDLNLAARYSDRVAVLAQGKLLAVDCPDQIFTPETLAIAFAVEAVPLTTPVGHQICLVRSL